MPSILSDDEKTIVKRAVPKASNKIHAVAVAKLYIAHPNRQRWTYTGLQGAAVIANDLVGHTYWIKLVDISPANRGVIWDQEIYDTFVYNQDRTFFHTFELETCLAGLSFVDDKEAKQFRKKVDEREKNAHKLTRANLFGTGSTNDASTSTKHGRFGGLTSLLPGHRHSSAPQAPPPQPFHNDTQSQPTGRSRASTTTVDLSDPAVQNILNDLLAMGITEDQIDQHADFIKSYLEQSKPAPSNSRAPPPPPPGRVAELSPQNTGTSKRGPPPAPPPSRRAGPATTLSQGPPSPSPSPPIRSRFEVPPPISDAGKLANDSSLTRSRADSSTNAPPPPLRPGKVPLSEPASQPSPPRAPPRAPVANPPALPPALPPQPSSARIVPSALVAHTVPPPLPPVALTPPPGPPPRNTRSTAPTPPAPPPSGPPAPPGPPPPSLPPSSATQAQGRGGLLADIQKGARLKKVSETEKRDRSSALAASGNDSGSNATPSSAGPSGAGAADGGGGMAGALASALAARKAKVSHSGTFSFFLFLLLSPLFAFCIIRSFHLCFCYTSSRLTLTIFCLVVSSFALRAHSLCML